MLGKFQMVVNKSSKVLYIKFSLNSLIKFFVRWTCSLITPVTSTENTFNRSFTIYCHEFIIQPPENVVYVFLPDNVYFCSIRSAEEWCRSRMV